MEANMILRVFHPFAAEGEKWGGEVFIEDLAHIEEPDASRFLSEQELTDLSCFDSGVTRYCWDKNGEEPLFVQPKTGKVAVAQTATEFQQATSGRQVFFVGVGELRRRSS